MNQSEIIINGVPYRAKKNKDGDTELQFKIGTFDDKQSLYKVLVKKEYWKNAVEGMTDANYFMIKGKIKACVTAKGMPFISVEANSIKIFNLSKDEDGNIDFNYEIPDNTDEIVNISQIINENEDQSIGRAKNKAINYIKNNGKFSKPIEVKKDNMVIISGHDQYVAALELGIKKVPVSYVNLEEE